MGPKSEKGDTSMIGVWEISSCHDFTAFLAGESQWGLPTQLCDVKGSYHTHFADEETKAQDTQNSISTLRGWR